jgi:hypothetical protein
VIDFVMPAEIAHTAPAVARPAEESHRRGGAATSGGPSGSSAPIIRDE